MSAKLIVLTSPEPRAGKTHFAAGLCCWLTRHGHHTAPLQLGAAAGDPVPCPEGGYVSFTTALLAEACGLPAEPVYAAGWPALPGLMERFDTVVSELDAGRPAPDGSPSLVLMPAEGDLIAIQDYPPLPFFTPPLTPQPSVELDALPAWTLGAGPRAGIVSLPHLGDFGELSFLRGAEWLTAPGIGRFGILVLPATTNAESDLDWMRDNGLATWIDTQRAGGCRVLASGWSAPGAEFLEPGRLSARRELSLLLGRRLPQPMPSEQQLHELADWFGAWRGLNQFLAGWL